MSLWTYKEHIRFGLALGYLGILISFNAFMSFGFWSWLFGVTWLAILIIALAEVLGYLAFALHIARIDTPVNALRHTAALTSSFGVAFGLQELARGAIGAGAAWAVACVGLLFVTIITQLFLNEIALLFDDPALARQRFMKASLKKLAYADIDHAFETQWNGQALPSPLAWLQPQDAFFLSHTPKTADEAPLRNDTPPEEALSRSNIGISGISDDAVTDRTCPNCGEPLSAAHYGAAKRWGYCAACKPVPSTNGVHAE